MAVAPRVLLADGDAALSRTLAWMLGQNGYDVNTAASLELLETRLETEHYDLLLLDLALLATGPVPAALPEALQRSALLAASAVAPDVELCRRLGVGLDAVLAKPFQIRTLLQRMAGALRVRRARDLDGAGDRERGQVTAIFAELVHARDMAAFATALVRGLSKALGVPRVSIVLAAAGDTHGTVAAASENPNLRDLRVALERYPEIERALGQDAPVFVADVRTDPLYDRVRALWKFDAVRVETVSALAIRFTLGPDFAGVMFLRTSDDSAPLGAADAAFVQRVLDGAADVRDAVTPDPPRG